MVPRDVARQVQDRSTPETGAWRGIRALTVAVVSVTVGIVCHLAGGGMRPPMLPCLALAMVAFAGALVVSRWRWTTVRLTLALAAVEAALHQFCAATTTAPTTAMTDHMGSTSASATAMSMPPDLRMLSCHLVGTVATVAALRRGETMVWSLLEAISLRVIRLLDVRTRLPVAATALAQRPVGVLRSTPVAMGQAIRGPPLR